MLESHLEEFNTEKTLHESLKMSLTKKNSASSREELILKISVEEKS